MTWLFLMKMELWLKSQINHFLLLNGLYDNLFMPTCNICFLQKANLYLNCSMKERNRNRNITDITNEISRIVAENPQSKSCSSRIPRCTELYHLLFHVTSSVKLQLCDERDCILVILSVYLPVPKPEIAPPQGSAQQKQGPVPASGTTSCGEVRQGPPLVPLLLPAQHPFLVLTITLLVLCTTAPNSYIGVVLVRWPIQLFPYAGEGGRVISQARPSKYPKTQQSEPSSPWGLSWDSFTTNEEARSDSMR